MAERTPSIETTVTEQKRYFLSGATLAVENRLEQLNILKNAVKKYERDIT
jgi:aldehyde dehydrogenase (NAD+)